MNSKSLILRIAFVFVATTIARSEPSALDTTAVLSHIPRERVQSSALVSVGYSHRRHILEIEFGNGAVYRYLDVPPSVYRDLMSAESKTRHYATNIKGNYRSLRVRPRKKDQSDN